VTASVDNQEATFLPHPPAFSAPLADESENDGDAERWVCGRKLLGRAHAMQASWDMASND
jgi:hypothetical protein